MKKILCFLILSASVLGCASIPKETTESATQAPEERFARDSLSKAEELETAGHLPEAWRQYKIALTVRPEDPAAKEGRERVEKALRKGAEEHYRAGLRMQKEGNQAQALRHYLAALRLWPDHPEALQMVMTRKPVPAEKQAARKAPPQPEIKEPLARTAPEEEVLAAYMDAPVREEPAVDQIAVYRDLGMELYRKGRYQDALFEFSKVLSAIPDDPLAKEHSYRSSFELAVECFQRKEYLAAIEHFLVSLKYNSNCQQCRFYIKKSEELFKEIHYKQGIEYYGKEQLAEAIAEWERVRALDPHYKRVDYYIKKAKDIQRKLDELKKESTEEGRE